MAQAVARNATNEEDRLGDASGGGPLVLDFCHANMDVHDLAEALANQPSKVFSTVETVLAANNIILQIPDVFPMYVNLKTLDLSSNQLTQLPESLARCANLTTLIARNNFLDETSFPKSLGNMTKLKELNISGNQLTRIPEEILNLAAGLTSLHLGANRISQLGAEIKRLRCLEVLYLGGNSLTELPNEVGDLKFLKIFVLCENQLESLPSSICNLKYLKSLLLHRNKLKSLPIELVKLRNLIELSLRDNPLVVQFVRDMVYNPPSLMELAARAVKIKKIAYGPEDLPSNVLMYLKHGHECVNPRCKGVYFNTRVEHIKFVDFCGKYHIPLLQYLCSPRCSDYRSPAYAASDSDSDDDRIRKVLLGPYAQAEYN